MIIGNHRDAWVFGGVDPNGGTACLMEISRALGRAMKNGKELFEGKYGLILRLASSWTEKSVSFCTEFGPIGTVLYNINIKIFHYDLRMATTSNNYAHQLGR